MTRHQKGQLVFLGGARVRCKLYIGKRKILFCNFPNFNFNLFIWAHHILPSVIIIQKVAFNIINKSEFLNNAFYKSKIFLGFLVLVDFLIFSDVVFFFKDSMSTLPTSMMSEYGSIDARLIVFLCG